MPVPQPKDKLIEKVHKMRVVVGDYLSKLEKEEVRKTFLSDLKDLNYYIRKDIKNVSDEGMSLVENIFLRCRKDGMDFNRSYEVSKSFYSRDYAKLERSELLLSIYEVVKGIHDRVIKVEK
jgi:hypothetical protein